MAETRILSVIGLPGSGKTTLVVALAAEFTRKGHRVMTMKHASAPVEVDRPGTDSFRLFHEAKAERTLLVTPNCRVSFERYLDDTDPIALARHYHEGAGIVLVEGFSKSPLPKIEVFRRAANPRPIYNSKLANASEWAAIVTDDDTLEAPIPVLRFRDTMWLQLLASMGWERARVI